MALSERPPGWLSSSTKYGPGEIRGYPVCMVNASNNVKQIYFGVSTVEFNNGVGWLAYPEELWKYTEEPIVLANIYLQSGQNTGVNIYTGNTLTVNRRVEFYVSPSIPSGTEYYVSYIFGLRN